MFFRGSIRNQDVVEVDEDRGQVSKDLIYQSLKSGRGVRGYKGSLKVFEMSAMSGKTGFGTSVNESELDDRNSTSQSRRTFLILQSVHDGADSTNPDVVADCLFVPKSTKVQTETEFSVFVRKLKLLRSDETKVQQFLGTSLNLSFCKAEGRCGGQQAG
jgi:hypothetical protein